MVSAIIRFVNGLTHHKIQDQTLSDQIEKKSHAGYKNDLAGQAICHPMVVTLLILWALNDHLFKYQFANTFTGKISDITGLAVTPILMYCTYELIWTWCGWKLKRPHMVLLFSITMTGLAFAGINLWESWAQAYRIGLALLQWPFRCLMAYLFHQPSPIFSPVQLTMDYTDLWTLPALYIPWMIMKSYPTQS